MKLGAQVKEVLLVQQHCFAIVDGVISGDAASSIGIAYQILDFAGPVGEYHRSVRLSGAAAFVQGTYDAGGGSGGIGGGGAGPVESVTLDAPFRVPSSGIYFGNALFAPILIFQSEATITHDLLVDSEGAFIGFRGMSNGAGTYRLNDGVIADLAGTAYMQIGRWNGGTILKNDEPHFTVGGWEGVPYLVGNPINNSFLPTSGIATYSLFGATSPINSSGAFTPGSFTGSAAILFGAGGGNSWKIGLDAEVTMNETSGVVVYDISTLGGIVDPSQRPINGSIAFYDITCLTGSSVCVSVTCQVNIRSALLAGPSGRDMGLSYTISQNSGDKIMGSAMFQVWSNDVLLRQDIGMTAIGIGPGSLVISNGFGRQSFSSDAIITYTDPVGDIEAFTSPSSWNDLQAGATTISDEGTSGQLTWSRWTNGAMGGTFGGNPGPILGEDQSVHIIAGTKAANIPVSGTAQYVLAGATAPTIADGSVAPGSFSGSMGVAFGANSSDSRVGLDLAVSIGGHTYDIATTGGASTPGTSEIALYGTFFGSPYGHPARPMSAVFSRAMALVMPASPIRFRIVDRQMWAM